LTLKSIKILIYLLAIAAGKVAGKLKEIKMTMTFDTQQSVRYRFRSSGYFGKAYEQVKSLIASVRRHSARKRAIVHLSEFSDHMLRDIGITRSEIDRAVYGRIAFSESHQSHPRHVG
jgi:uncharacterized protein YjiS (DUF1127 family)